jgi:hypothetical protein
LAVSLIHESVVSLAIASCNFNLADMGAIGLFADISGIDLFHEIVFDFGTLVDEELVQLEATVADKVALDIAELLHQLKIPLTCDDLKWAQWALSTPRHVERRDILVVVHDSSQQKLIFG